MKNVKFASVLIGTLLGIAAGTFAYIPEAPATEQAQQRREGRDVKPGHADRILARKRSIAAPKIRRAMPRAGRTSGRTNRKAARKAREIKY